MCRENTYDKGFLFVEQFISMDDIGKGKDFYMKAENDSPDAVSFPFLFQFCFLE